MFTKPTNFFPIIKKEKKINTPNKRRQIERNGISSLSSRTACTPLYRSRHNVVRGGWLIDKVIESGLKGVARGFSVERVAHTSVTKVPLGVMQNYFAGLRLPVEHHSPFPLPRQTLFREFKSTKSWYSIWKLKDVREGGCFC